MSVLQKFILALTLLFFLIAVGTFGFVLIEGMSFFDGLYMTVITMSTVGFHEVHPLTIGGRIFTIFLIFSSLAIMAFGITVISAFILEGQFKEVARRRKMEARLKDLKDHFIICGFKRSTAQIIDEFLKSKVPFVVVSYSIFEIERLWKNDNVLYLEGSPENDEILLEAGITHARGLVVTLPTDAEALFVILSARRLNPNLEIVAEAIEEKALTKMSTAGANRVISSETIGGRRIASLILRPEVVSFLDIMTYGVAEVPLHLEQVVIEESGPLVGLNLAEAQIPQKTGLLVVAIKKKSSDRFVFNPSAATRIEAHDVLIILGEENNLGILKRYACVT